MQTDPDRQIMRQLFGLSFHPASSRHEIVELFSMGVLPLNTYRQFSRTECKVLAVYLNRQNNRQKHFRQVNSCFNANKSLASFLLFYITNSFRINRTTRALQTAHMQYNTIHMDHFDRRSIRNKHT